MITTTSAAPAPRQFVMDTGPWLCLGFSPFLLNEYKRFFKTRTHWAPEVRDEIEHQAKSKRHTASAAAAILSDATSWMNAPRSLTMSEHAKATALQSMFDSLAVAKGKRSGPEFHWGESQSIAMSIGPGHVLISNDNDARFVARKHAVTAHTIANIAAYMGRRGANLASLSRELRTMRLAEIDVGRSVGSLYDLRFYSRGD